MSATLVRPTISRRPPWRLGELALVGCTKPGYSLALHLLASIIWVMGLFLRLFGLYPRLSNHFAMNLLHLFQTGVDDRFYLRCIVHLKPYGGVRRAEELVVEIIWIIFSFRDIGDSLNLDGGIVVIVTQTQQLLRVLMAGFSSFG